MRVPTATRPATWTPEHRAERAGHARLLGKGLAVAAVLLGAALLAFWLYQLAVHLDASQVNSDGSTVVLQGRSMASGNLLLHGWGLSLDSWWTLDVVFFAVATLIDGVRPILLLAVPAAIATLLVVAAVVLARRGRRDLAALAGAVVVVGAIALPSPALAAVLLAGPIHQSTTLYALVAFIALRRNRFGAGWVLAVVFLTAGLLGDLQMASYGVAPVVLAGLVAMLRRRSWRSGSPAVAAAASSLVAAVVVRKVVEALGGFGIGPTNPHATFHQMVTNLRTTVSGLGELFGVVNHADGTGGVPAALLAVHILVALLVAAGCLAALWSLVHGVVRGTPAEAGPDATIAEPEPWRIDDLLLIALVGPMVDYVYLSLMTETAYLRYLTATLVFAAVLAARMVTRWWAGRPAISLRRAATVVVAVVLACLLAGGAIELGHTTTKEADSRLATFLEAHHLDSGVGAYWEASQTTVESSGVVKVRPVTVSPTGVMEAYRKGPQRAWFRDVDFDFVAWSGPVGFGGIDAAVATKTWGPPTRTYLLGGGQFHVLVWSHPQRITQFEPN